MLNYKVGSECVQSKILIGCRQTFNSSTAGPSCEGVRKPPRPAAPAHAGFRTLWYLRRFTACAQTTGSPAIMKASSSGIAVPSGGKPIGYSGGKFSVPDTPILPFSEGDGTGRDIWKASRRVFDAAVEKAYKGKRRIAWYEVFAGEKAKAKFDTWLPDDTVAAIREFRVAIKGPLTTPVGGGIRSLNVALRQILDLYCCVRPVKYYAGVPSPVKHPERMDIVI